MSTRWIVGSIILAIAIAALILNLTSRPEAPPSGAPEAVVPDPIAIGSRIVVRSRVVDETGRGLAGVHVRLHERTPGFETFDPTVLFASLRTASWCAIPPVKVEATTDEEGRFAIEVPLDEPCSVSLVSPDGRVDYRRFINPSDWAARSQRAAEVLPRSHRRFQGRLVDEAGRGRPDLRIRLLITPPTNTNAAMMRLWSEQVIATDGEGAFRFDLREDERAQGFVEHETLGQGIPILAPEYFARDGLHDMDDIVVSPLAPFTARVLDEDSRPVPDRTVLCARSGGFLARETRTDAEGRFTIERFASETFGAAFALRDPELCFVPRSKNMEDIYLGLPLWGLAMIEVTPESPDVPDVLAAERRGSATGLVIDGETGEPVANARIAATIRNGDGQLEVATTDTEGRYRLDHLPFGWHGIIVWSDDHAPSWSERFRGRGREDGETVFAMETGGEAVVETTRLWPAVTIRGRVIDSESRPAVGLTVHAPPRPDDLFSPYLDLDPARWPRTDAEGRFELHGVWAVGDVATLQVIDPRGTIIESTIDLRPALAPGASRVLEGVELRR
ncbi:MAG: carboxypeptidase-like regulatory domain-containing protein [Planctomycetota bacterium]